MTMQPTAQQLDIFADSRDVVLRNGVLDQLQRRDGAAARAALEELAAGYPDDRALSAMTVLVRELEGGSTTPFADHAALAVARRHLENEVVPAVRQVLPAQTGHAWLAPCWSSLAQRAAGLAFRGVEAGNHGDSHAGNHAAPLWLLAGEWAAAGDAVKAIESWWRIPAPLMWMTEARYRMEGLDAAWPLLVELAWLAPARFAALLSGLGDASLDALRRRFDAEFPGSGEVDDYAWFPVWLLVVKPALASRFGEARVQREQTASRVTALLGEILRREHEGDQHELVSLRQEFSRLHAGLFEAYMATRKVQHR
ncbi:hypothetical protein Q8F57_043515 [Paraburkholderia terrae]|uniref:hypothetical protein n=1 Tax=Paraburkholderia terrae TaxID=311230 RepID=UPI00296B46CE|nr:hypothetical protein [Paraburkholderia terrae]MDW3656528.1 hypothetical protein [Paraburkholderia terrae]